MAATTSGKDKVLRWTRILFGPYDLSGDARTYGGADITFSEAPNWGWANSVMGVLAGSTRTVGIRDFQALFNDASGKSWETMVGGALWPVSMLFGGGGEPAIPDPAYLMDAVQIGSAITFDSDIGVISGSLLPRSGGSSGNPLGVVLANQALTVTASLSSHDNEDATTDGWMANLHVLVSSGGEWVFEIEHSSNDSTWTTLGTFTIDASTTDAESISGTGTVNQYVRLKATRTAGTCTVAVTFSRNYGS